MRVTGIGEGITAEIEIEIEVGNEGDAESDLLLLLALLVVSFNLVIGYLLVVYLIQLMIMI